MPRTFDDSLSEDLDVVFFNVNEFAKSYTLTRGTLSTADVGAILTSRTYEIDDRRGSVVSVESIDIDIPTASYLIDSEEVNPQTGDKLTDSSGNVYEVLPLPGLQCFDANEDRSVLRVHVKRVQ